MSAYIKGISYYLPEKVVTNEDLVAEFPEWDVEKVYNKVGVQERHLAGEHETAGDLAEKAALKLFKEYHISPAEIDFLLLCTQSPDYHLPSTACILQDRLGIPTSAGAFDYDLGCSGCIYGMAVAKGLITAGLASNVLLLTAETYTKYLHPEDKSNRTIFGDGAAACLISKEKGLAEIEDFINGKLKEIFAFNDANKLGINGLEQYAYVQSAYEETQDDQMSDDDGTGDFSGESSENGFTNTTELVSDKAKINRPKNESKGVELVEKITTVEPSNEGEIEGQYDPELEEEDDEEQGEEEQEEDNNQKEENEEQENEEEQEEENDDEDQEEEEKLPDSGEAEGGKNKTDKDGTSGTFMVPLKIKNMALRTFQEDGLWNHRILIQSSRNVENCTLKIFIGGEDSDEELEITYSNIGTVEGNSVKDVSLKADSTNVIIVRFEDNMKHSLIVNAYENK